MAIKVISKNVMGVMNNGRGNLVNEIKVHWAVEECANILKLHEIFED